MNYCLVMDDAIYFEYDFSSIILALTIRMTFQSLEKAFPIEKLSSYVPVSEEFVICGDWSTLLWHEDTINFTVYASDGLQKETLAIP